MTTPLACIAAGATDIGQRDHNEDHVLVRPDLGLFLLADGAGGHSAGNVASALATTTVANVYESSASALADRPEVDEFGLWTDARRLAAAIQRANEAIIEIAKGTRRYKGMGTTIVALALSPASSMLHVAHVGDSRCYRFRAGCVEPLTNDHSLVADVLETQPDIDDALLAQMPRHVVTRALGMQENLRVSMRTMRALAGDVYVLCSDGLSDVLDEGAIQALLEPGGTPDERVRALIDAAVLAGAPDNVGAVVVQVQLGQDATSGTQLRKRPSSRPKVDLPPPSVGVRGAMGSAPEIVIVGVETHVVPAEAANAAVMDALGRFARLRQMSRPEIADPKPARCAECGQPMEGGATKCPTCGAEAARA